ncbi:unnamed protein product (macronuclear) [Paramecium tetraurelia]|uniref:RING-type domain-containing protein n=1 Tax=Paramecium tetraurelia TaxID=5888 RepID=A0BVD6_PARTE|nr:uncharacterized protein GSPATT00005749001 [Paramecium tetraurelia]CAK62503.1 unnamed protein product [Paramecium tetraurelia]|eukprot:XP_001429901.1 hypothetical protein (macronuclear) [Paramecium tetraurelia strain d4-2]
MDYKTEQRQKLFRISNPAQKAQTLVPRQLRDDSLKPQQQQQMQKIVVSDDQLRKQNEQLKSELTATKEQYKILQEDYKKLQSKYQNLQSQMRGPHQEMLMAQEMQRHLRHYQYYEFIQEAMMPQQQFQTDGMTYEQILELQEQIGHVSKGLTKQEIKKIPKRQVNQKQKDPCTICYNDIEKFDKIRELKCRHQYHSKCIKKWLLSQKKCPICQTEV